VSMGGTPRNARAKSCSNCSARAAINEMCIRWT
jgi:hypothetical protein